MLCEGAMKRGQFSCAMRVLHRQKCVSACWEPVMVDQGLGDDRGNGGWLSKVNGFFDWLQNHIKSPHGILRTQSLKQDNVHFLGYIFHDGSSGNKVFFFYYFSWSLIIVDNWKNFVYKVCCFINKTKALLVPQYTKIMVWFIYLFTLHPQDFKSQRCDMR